MSFSLDIKREIAGNPLQKRWLMEARAYGFFLFLRRMDADEVSFKTESLQAANGFGGLARTLLSSRAAVEITGGESSRRPVFTCSLPSAEDRQRLAVLAADVAAADGFGLKTAEEAGSFLAGAFLAVGTLTDPQKSVHLEFIIRREPLALGLYHLLEDIIPGTKLTARRGSSIVYYKDRGQICDLLTLMGASKSSLALIEVEMIKGVRNRANRVTNCETANIDKAVSAAAAQIADITAIQIVDGLDSLSQKLKETAVLRLENPDLSLRELAELHNKPPSRSVLHRRFETIAKIADTKRL